MTSREISELTGKEHKHVRRDIEKMLTDLREDGSKFGRIYQDAYGREQNEYALPQNLASSGLWTPFDIGHSLESETVGGNGSRMLRPFAKSYLSR
ncbi:Rha family transcriptional regulator [Brytella acorum]|uniref:Rha family transcriptional regulator n=1 Tax=Brytella acorum TaxID=2959299 RepID=A0AA35UP48_9PROT|nr:Rha family transcriptional regulator [Brytella acorum]CAI9119556.1 Rha family transcriptional regulator [Brytella acorum]